MKNRNYITAIIILFFCVNLTAQRKQRGPDPEKVKAFKIAYLTDKLDLSSKEAEKFWPEYNQHEKTISDLRQQENATIKKFIRRRSDANNLSEADAKKVLIAVKKIQKKMNTENEKFFERMQKILPYKKILKLEIAERGFKRKLLENLRERRKKLLQERN